jgi:hypothetical protein
MGIENQPFHGTVSTPSSSICNSNRTMPILKWANASKTHADQSPIKRLSTVVNSFNSIGQRSNSVLNNPESHNCDARSYFHVSLRVPKLRSVGKKLCNERSRRSKAWSRLISRLWKWFSIQLKTNGLMIRSCHCQSYRDCRSVVTCNS